MDSEDGIPTGYHLESHSASHWVIEELMLLANRCVATRLFNSAIKDFSVLRNHKPPENKKVPVECMNSLHSLNYSGQVGQAI